MKNPITPLLPRKVRGKQHPSRQGYAPDKHNGALSASILYDAATPQRTSYPINSMVIDAAKYFGHNGSRREISMGNLIGLQKVTALLLL